jgi:predicted ATP-grasp superfamily ATP-dependent carboligase
VYVLDDTKVCIARYSKYCQRFLHFPDMKKESKLCAYLERLAADETFRGSVIFPTHDGVVATLAKHKDRLKDYFRIATPAWPTTKIAYDKRLSYKLAVECQVPVPKTLFPQDINEARDLCEETGYPLLIKPAVMHTFYSKLKVKVIKVENEAQLIDAYQKVCQVIPASEIMIQELIPGPPQYIHSFCSFFKQGTVWASFSNRHLRRIPMDFGKVATTVELVENSLLEDISRKLLSKLGYYGISEVEFKLDPRDGILKFLEINPRSWKQMSLGNLLNINLAYMLYQDMTSISRQQPMVNANHNGRWVDLVPDFAVSIQEMLRGRMNPRDYIHSLKQPVEFAVWSRDDPTPFLKMMVMLPILWYMR